MKHLENYYRNLCEQLQQQIAILEAKMKDKKKDKKDSKKDSKKEKMADKDYDGDGEVESSKDEYFGSKDKAIKKKMAEKKKVIKEGREIHGGIMNYGGFPRVINEGGVVQQFNDADDTGGEKIATHPDELTALETGLEKMRSDFDDREHELSDPEYRWSASRSGREAMGKILDMEERIRQHPQFKANLAAAEAKRASEPGAGFFSQRGVKLEPSDTFAERGLNMGPRSLPPTDYDLGRSSRKDR
jgi:hypothetical protein